MNHKQIQEKVDDLLKRHPWLIDEFARHAKHFKACFEKWKSFEDWCRECERATRDHPLGERHIRRAQSARPPCPSTGEIPDRTCWSYATVGIIWDELAVHSDSECLVRHILSDQDSTKDAYTFTLYLMGGSRFEDPPRHIVYECSRLADALSCVERDVVRIADDRTRQQKPNGPTEPSEAPGSQPLPPEAGLIYEKLRSLERHQAMTLPAIQRWYEATTEKNLDEGTWKRWRPELEAYGMKNRPKVGYYIEQE